MFVEISDLSTHRTKDSPNCIELKSQPCANNASRRLMSAILERWQNDAKSSLAPWESRSLTSSGSRRQMALPKLTPSWPSQTPRGWSRIARTSANFPLSEARTRSLRESSISRDRKRLSKYVAGMEVIAIDSRVWRTIAEKDFGGDGYWLL